MNSNATYLLTVFYDLILTAIGYTAFPVIRRLLNRNAFERDRAKKIALWNSIAVCTIFFVIVITQQDDGTLRVAPAILYYWVNYFILTAKTKNRSNDMSNAEKKESGTQYCFTKIADEELTERGAFNNRWRDFDRTDPLDELFAEFEKSAKNQPVKEEPAPKQEDVLQDIQKKLKMQEIARLTQVYQEKMLKLRKNNKTRWILTFCGFALVIFVIILIAMGNLSLDDVLQSSFSEIGTMLLLAIVLTAIHFLINVSIFGWLIQKIIAADRELDPIKKQIQELENTLNNKGGVAN